MVPGLTNATGFTIVAVNPALDAPYALWLAAVAFDLRQGTEITACP